jgi:hypothetical protein
MRERFIPPKICSIPFFVVAMLPSFTTAPLLSRMQKRLVLSPRSIPIVIDPFVSRTFLVRTGFRG